VKLAADHLDDAASRESDDGSRERESLDGSRSRERESLDGSRSRERESLDGSRSRERRCIASGETLPEEKLVRFAADPDGNVVPDIAATLPGRGMWVGARRALIEKAVAKNLFSKSAKAPLKADSDLADRVERLLVARMQADLGLSRRSGALVLGFDNVLRALDSHPAPALLVEASDGAADGRRKLMGSAYARGLKIQTIDWLSAEELSLALGRENVIHAALKSGRLTQRLMIDAGRLQGLRQVGGGSPAGNERDV
jgi:predicted RNA-binding protein YlxR (DUF448 family)